MFIYSIQSGGCKMFLEINELVKYYGSGGSRVKVLQGVTDGVEKGNICVILGSSGCGKSTLLNIVGGIEKPDGGYVSINGEKLADMSEKKLTRYRRKHLGYVFQFYNLIFMRWIYGAFMLKMHGWLTFFVAPVTYVKMLAIGIASYFAIGSLQYLRIRHIPMEKALKNNE